MMEDAYEREHRQRRYEEAGLTDLRRDALNILTFVFIILAVLLLLAGGVNMAYGGERVAYLAIGLAALAGSVKLLSSRSVVSSSLLLVGGLVLLLASAYILLGLDALLAGLVVPVLIATVLIGNEAGIGTLALGSALLTISFHANHASLSPDALLLTVGLGISVLVIAAVLWQSFYIVLDWSWHSYTQAQKLTAEARERQAELGLLNKNLNLSYERLEQVSGQLARARMAAEDARRLKSEFAAGVSHELRTPLNLIIGLSEMMVVTPPKGAERLPDVYREDIEAIYRNACHISNLIDDVLDLSQIEAHRMGLAREWVSLADIVEQATSTVATLFANTGLKLETDVPATLPPVFADPVRVRQILINLLNNAVRFTEEGTISVRAYLAGPEVIVEVADTGAGISPEDLPTVFQVFWHSGKPARGRRGSGLGLAVSKRFAELHGGRMWVTSEPGQGSTFFLALPLGQQEGTNLEPEPTRPFFPILENKTPANPSVMLVAPEDEALRVFRRYLDGFQVLVASDATQAAQAAADPSVRALIVDNPKRTESVRRSLHTQEAGSECGRLPIITCHLRTSRNLAQELGVLDYLVKPISQHQLERALRRLGRAPRDLLFVDDDPEMLHLLSRMARAIAPRSQVRTATDGRRALDLMLEETPQVVLLDLLMPGLDGRSVLAAMRENECLSSVPVIIITAREAEDDRLVADALQITQAGGMRVADLTRCVKASIDSLYPLPKP